MYSIFSDGICVHSDMFLEKDNKVLTPKWSAKDNTAGTVSFVLPKQNVHYDEVKRLSSVIQLRRDNEVVWEGRIIEDNIDFWNQRHITCEGALAYLNDTTQPPSKFQNITIYNFLKTLIDRHNARVGPEKRFEMGAVTVHDTNDSIYKYTNNESTWECISSKLIDVFGGHIRVRYQNGKRLIDYLAEYPKTSVQEVQFRSNLLDFTRNFDLSKVATVIMPRGARLEEQEIEGLEAYLDVKSVNGGSPYVTSEEAISQFGWIEKVVDWDDVTVPANLLKKAQDYLKDVQFEQMVIEANLFDLRLINPELDSIDLLDEVRCISHPHGMDRIFPVTSIDIPLDDPGHATYIFGETYDVTMTGALVKSKRNQNKITSDISSRVTEQGNTFQEELDEQYTTFDKKIKDVETMIQETNEYVSEKAVEILQDAKDNATSLITMATNGFITITKEQNGTQELYITNTLDYTKATKMWRWNMNGLGYSNDGGKTFPLALTMDGSIVADFITTGTMSANRVRTGSIVSANGNTAWNLDTGELAMYHGAINLGNVFTVNDDGYMTAISGKIANFEITRYSLKNDRVGLDSNGMNVYYNNVLLGSFTSMNLFNSGNYGVAINAPSGQAGISFAYNNVARLTFVGKAMSGYVANKWYMTNNLDMRHNYIENFYFDPEGAGPSKGVSGTTEYKKITGISSSGTITQYYNNCYMTFTRGILTAASF